MKKHAIIPIFISHRGCNNKCVFCNQKAITTCSGDVSVEDARNTIDSWLSTLDSKETEIEISFFGGSFTGIPMEEQSAFLALAKEYKDKGLVSKIHCSTRPDYIDKTILDNLKKYSLDVIELGVQSFDPQVLKLSKRGHNEEVVYKACKLIKEYGFTLGIQLMIGLPGDSKEKCLESVKKTIKIGPAIARLYPTVVLPNTELFEMREKGTYEAFSEEEMLDIVKDMYLLLSAAGINVIRIGLKSNELIKGDTYHPAFGQLVKSRIERDKIEALLKSLQFPLAANDNQKFQVNIVVPSKDINYVVGHKGCNKKYFQENYSNLSIKFIKDDAVDDIYIKTR